MTRLGATAALTGWRPSTTLFDVGIPETRYTTCQGASVAYQVHGEGRHDVLAIHDWMASVDAHWDHPGVLRWEQVHESFARVIEFDQRGMGVSDRLPPESIGRLEDWIDDAVAVLDEVGSAKASVVGQGFGGQAALLLAVRHPERVEKLVLANSYARLTSGDGYPHGMPEEAVDGVVELVRGAWGSGRLTASAAPGLANDPVFCARLERAGASPTAAAAWSRAMYTSDIRSLCEQVTVPTLVIFSGDITFISVEHSRWLADHIPGAILKAGASTSFYWGDGSLSDYVSFLTGEAPELGERELVSVLFTDIVESTNTAAAWGDERWRTELDQVDLFVKSQIDRYGGELVKQTGDGHLATFATPGAAVRAALSISAGVQVLEVSMRCGVHTGEITRRSDRDIAGTAVNACARIAALAEADEVLVSRTVADLIAGTDLKLIDRGNHLLKGVPGEWNLFHATE